VGKDKEPKVQKGGEGEVKLLVVPRGTSKSSARIPVGKEYMTPSYKTHRIEIALPRVRGGGRWRLIQEKVREKGEGRKNSDLICRATSNVYIRRRKEGLFRDNRLAKKGRQPTMAREEGGHDKEMTFKKDGDFTDFEVRELGPGDMPFQPERARWEMTRERNGAERTLEGRATRKALKKKGRFRIRCGQEGQGDEKKVDQFGIRRHRISIVHWGKVQDGVGSRSFLGGGGVLGGGGGGGFWGGGGGGGVVFFGVGGGGVWWGGGVVWGVGGGGVLGWGGGGGVGGLCVGGWGGFLGGGLVWGG